MTIIYLIRILTLKWFLRSRKRERENPISCAPNEFLIGLNNEGNIGTLENPLNSAVILSGNVSYPENYNQLVSE